MFYLPESLISPLAPSAEGSISLIIVVPTLNSYVLLDRLVSSLQQQSWQHWRICFIDGPSCSDHRQWLQHCCLKESRCSWIAQDPGSPGIFGAMNQGFSVAEPGDWILFWGSDDWAARPTVLMELIYAIQRIQGIGVTPDLVVCRGRYVDAVSGALGRTSVFNRSALLVGHSYRRALWLGSTPPHQGTLFGPGARSRMSRYESDFYVSADLDYFLKISCHPGLIVYSLKLELVHMSNGGFSSQQTQRRFQEVCRAYRNAFGIFWFIPMLLRYLRRMSSLFTY